MISNQLAGCLFVCLLQAEVQHDTSKKTQKWMWDLAVYFIMIGYMQEGDVWNENRIMKYTFYIEFLKSIFYQREAETQTMIYWLI